MATQKSQCLIWMTRDRNRYRLKSDEEYRAGKKQEWSKSLGLFTLFVWPRISNTVTKATFPRDNKKNGDN